jgi:hypothetical protein
MGQRSPELVQIASQFFLSLFMGFRCPVPVECVGMGGICSCGKAVRGFVVLARMMLAKELLHVIPLFPSP